MLYIHGKGIVSAAHKDGVLVTEAPIADPFFKTIDPDYSQYLNPTQARRTGKHVKMGIAAAMMALRDAGIEKPDAIFAGTGLGCLEDTEKFLKSLIEFKETALSPTSFIQSTHNTVAAQIALLLGCTGYNMTYSHRNFSFEWALLDALLKQEEEEGEKNFLVGATDELSAVAFQIMKQMGLMKPAGGELAAFFLMSGEKQKSQSAVSWTVTHYHRNQTTLEAINVILHQHGIAMSDLSLILFDGPEVSHPNAYGFKQLCGENFSASAMALWLADEMIRTQQVPSILSTHHTAPKKIERVLLCNSFAQRNLSVTLVSKC